MRSLHLFGLDRMILDEIRDRIRQGVIPIGNEYYWVQYKDGSSWVFDMSYEDDAHARPVLDKRKILYVEYWDAANSAYISLNTDLSQKQANRIIRELIADEDGTEFYNEVIPEYNFPYDVNPYEYETIF